MPLSDWHIITPTYATRMVNGKDVEILAKPGQLSAAIEAWEEAEHHRMILDLGHLGRLVNEALSKARDRQPFL